MELFLSRGIANTTIDQIVAPFGVGRRHSFGTAGPRKTWCASRACASDGRSALAVGVTDKQAIQLHENHLVVPAFTVFANFFESAV
jgi:hypothetical protein